MSKKIKLNQEQQQFVSSLDNNILVSASAGSGKTSTMIQKLLSLISSGVSVNDILVLTFTDAAASEMKQKLYISLIDLASNLENELEATENKTDKELTKNNLKNIYQSIEDITYADIGTFHSTFKKIITKYFYHLDLDPAFSLLNAQEQNILLMQSLNDVFDDYILNKDIDFYNLQEVFNKNRKNTAFKEIVLDMFFMSQEKPNFNKWFANAINESFNTNLKENKLVVGVFNKHKNKILQLKDKINFLYNFTTDNEWKSVSGFLQVCVSLVTKIEKTTNFEEFFNVITPFKFSGRRTKPKDLDPDYYDVYDDMMEVTESFKGAVFETQEDLVFNTIEALLESFELSEQYLLKLKEVLDNVIATYEKKKASKSQLDFNDLQTKMLSLLEIDIVKQDVQQQYKYVFVDEFQDVNEIQNAILQLISSGNNLNMIGDVKQSIYEFRLASPDIFINNLNSFKENNSKGEVIEFNKNYRSSKNILDFVNLIFNEIITENTIKLNYKETSQLIAGNQNLADFDQVLKQKDINNIKLTIINTDKKDNKNKIENETDTEEIDENKDIVSKQPELTKEQIEAYYVASEINSLVGKPFYNAKTNRQEFIKYKDIAILTRSGGAFITALQKVLKEFKIPSVLSVKNKIFNTYEVSVLFSYLKLISNHYDDYALSTAMLSVIGGFGYNDLATIRLFNNNQKVSFYECVVGFLNEYNSEEEKENSEQKNEQNSNKIIVSKIKKFFSNLSFFRESLQTQSVYDVMLAVLNKFDLINHFKSMPDGDFKVNNINEFLKLLNADLFKYNITYIVNYLTQLSEKDDFNISMPATANSVTILTMHKSKGLEYPAVILADLGKSFNENIKRKDIAISQNLGIGIKLKNPKTRVSNSSLQFRAVVNDKLQNELRENIRLFYVATTRAKNYLSIIGRYEYSKILQAMQKDPMDASNFLEFLFIALKSEVQTIKNYLSSNNKDAKYIINNNKNAEFVLEFINDDIDLNEENNNFKLDIEKSKNNDILTLLDERFNFKYEKIDSVAIKNSVTSLLQETDYVLNNENSRFFKTSEISADSGFALELGIAYHSIMQKIDYSKHTENEIDEIIKVVIAKSSNPQKMGQLIIKNQIIKAVSFIKDLIKDGYLNILKEQQFILQDNYNNLISNSNITQKVLVQGVIDLIVEFKDSLVLIDFKTNKGLNKQSFKDLYELQLSLYEKAIKHVYPNKQIKKYIYSFELQSLIII